MRKDIPPRFPERAVYTSLVLVLMIGAFALVTLLVILFSLPRTSFSVSGIRRISVTGNYFLSGNEILRIVAFTPASSYRVDLREWAGKLKGHRMIAGVRVFVKGDSLIIRLEEHRPNYRVVIGDQKFWLTEKGKLIEMKPQDEGKIFEAIRRQVSIRAGRIDQFDDPAFTSLAIFCSNSVDEFLPGQGAELRFDLLGNVELITTQGIRFKLGKLGVETPKKIEVIPQIIRVVKNRGRAVELVDFSRADIALIKYAE